jgi:hypothetical protein
MSASDRGIPLVAEANCTLIARLPRIPDLLIRRYLCGHPDPFRSVRDLGLVSLGCPAGVRIIRRLSIRVAPSVAPQSQPARVRVMVFKSIGGSGLRGAAACYVSTWG